MDPEQWHLRAVRLSRVIGQDLALYHRDKLAAAIAEDRLFEAFADEMRAAWSLYRSRLPADIDPHGHLLRANLVDALLQEKGHIGSAMW